MHLDRFFILNSSWLYSLSEILKNWIFCSNKTKGIPYVEIFYREDGVGKERENEQDMVTMKLYEEMTM